MTLLKEKQQAIELRKQGKSLNQICGSLNLAKSTIFPWIRHIDINVKKTLSKNLCNGPKKMQEKYRIIRESAYTDFYKKAPMLLKNPFLRDFIVSYFCEGVKDRNRIDFTNTEPLIIKMALNAVKFFTEKPPTYSLLGHTCTLKMKRFWAKQLNINEKIIKGYKKGGKCKNTRFKFGTFKIRINDTVAVARIMAVTDFVFKEWENYTCVAQLD